MIKENYHTSMILLLQMLEKQIMTNNNKKDCSFHNTVKHYESNK